MGAARKEVKAKLIPKFFSTPTKEKGSFTEPSADALKLPVGGEYIPYKTGYIIFNSTQPENFFNYALDPKESPERFGVPKFKCEDTLYTAANVSGSQILLGTSLGKIVVLEIGKKDINHPYSKPYDRAVERSAHKSQISAIASLPEQKLTATAAADGSLYLWDEKRLCSFFSTDLEFRAVLASGEVENVISPEADEESIEFIHQPRISATQKNSPPPKYSKLAFSKNGELAGVMSDGTVHYFSAKKIAMAFEGHQIKPDVLPFKVLQKHLGYFYIIGNIIFTPSYTKNIFNSTSDTVSHVIDTAITRYDLEEQTLKQIKGEKLTSFNVIAGDFLICKEDSSSMILDQHFNMVSENQITTSYNAIIKIDGTFYGLETLADKNTPPYSKLEPINVKNLSCVALDEAFNFSQGRK